MKVFIESTAVFQADAKGITENTDPAGVPFAKPFSGRKYLNRATELAILATDGLHTPVIPEGVRPEVVGLCTATFGAHFKRAADQFGEIMNKERPLISPMQGPNNTPNAITGQLSIYQRTRALTQSFADSGTAGLEAFLFGVDAIIKRRADRVLVVGTEFRPPEIDRHFFGQSDGGGIAVALLLTNENVLQQPSRQVLASYAAHARSFVLDTTNSFEVNEAIRNCLRRAVAGQAWPTTSGGIFMPCTRSDFNTLEYRAVKSVLNAKTPQRLSTTGVQGTGNGNQCISALLRLHQALSAVKAGKRTSSGDASLSKDEDDIHLLITDISNDGTLGCLIIRLERRRGNEHRFRV